MSRRSQDNSSTREDSWESAAKYAAERVKEARATLAELESVLAICIDRRDRGEPFPCEAQRKSKARAAT